jgi:hypothetical protein
MHGKAKARLLETCAYHNNSNLDRLRGRSSRFNMFGDPPHGDGGGRGLELSTKRPQDKHKHREEPGDWFFSMQVP